MRDERQEGRQYPRAIVAGIYEVSILNIGLAGVVIEHVDALRPGAHVSLGLNLQGMRANVDCRVVDSVVHRSAMQPDGERALIYHTGVEFLNLCEETRQAISHYIQSNTGNGNRSSAREEQLREHLLRELKELDGRVNGARRILEEGLKQIALSHR